MTATPGVTLHVGDALAVLRTLPDGAARCCVTSPPYFGLRDYGVEGQIGLEPTPDAYVARLVEVFREVRRVLADDGTLWLNLGDSYANDSKWGGQTTGKHAAALHGKTPLVRAQRSTGLKSKDLIGIPWLVAFALRADGWYLRSDIIWAKPNPMPESVRDRPTRAHEYLFLLSKASRYFYNADAIREPGTSADPENAKSPEGWDMSRGSGGHGSFHRNGREPGKKSDKQRGHGRRHAGFNDRWDGMTKAEQGAGMRNKRSVWTIAPKPFKEAHFATFPPALVEPCILAGSAPGDTVLDPFGGSGTTASVALSHRRNAIHIDLNGEYSALAEARVGEAAERLRQGVLDMGVA